MIISRIQLDETAETLESLQRRLAALTYIDGESGNHCVQYLAWCERDPDVRARQNIIASVGRMPIMLDYEHAEHLINSAEQRAAEAKAAEAARAACRQIAGWPKETVHA